MHTCRFCKQGSQGRKMFKYAARHWAHFECWLEAKGKEIQEPWIHRHVEVMFEVSMHGWQLREFPVFKLADWLEAHKTESAPGKSWVDKACGILKRAIARAEKEPVKA